MIKGKKCVEKSEIFYTYQYILEFDTAAAISNTQEQIHKDCIIIIGNYVNTNGYVCAHLKLIRSHTISFRYQVINMMFIYLCMPIFVGRISFIDYYCGLSLCQIHLVIPVFLLMY